MAELLATPSFEAGLAWCLEHPLDAPSAYRFSKQVLIEWTLQASATGRHRGVRVVSVSPGGELPLSDAEFEGLVMLLLAAGNDLTSEDADPS